MRLFGIRCISPLLTMGVIACFGGPSTITMQSGERLIGEVSTESTESTLILISPLLGELELPRNQILKQEPPVIATDGAENSDPDLASPEQMVAAGASAPLPSVPSDPAGEPSLTDRLARLQTPDSWEGNLRFGLDLGGGNSTWTQIYSNGNLIIDPELSPNYYRYTGSYTYRTTKRDGETVKLTDRYDANFTYRRDITGPLFLQNSLGGRVDEVKGINHEIQEMVGVGFRVEPAAQFEFVLGGGAGLEDFDPDFEDSRSGVRPVASLFQELSWEPFEKATITQDFSYFTNTDDEEQYNYVLSASVRYRLTELLGLEVSFKKSFDNDLGDGGVQDDSQWSNAIVVYF